MDKTDEQLILEFKAGHKAAAQALFLRYKYRILNFCWRLLANRVEAEDAAAEVFMALFTNTYEAQSNVKFSTWLYTVARNQCVTMIRRRSRYAQDLDPEISAGHLEMPNVPREEMSQKEAGDHVRLAIEKLPLEQREAIVLQHYEGLSYEQIGEVLGCSLDKVKILVYRAKENLKKQLAFLLKEGRL